MPPERRYLFLQGPHGPLFRRIGDALRAQGFGVWRINLCGGDRHDWPDGSIDFTGDQNAWPAFVGGAITGHAITDLVLFGDCRPMHRVAHDVASARGVRIWVCEEGYLRPDWMTLELDGVNGHSRLGHDPQDYLDKGAMLPPFPSYPPVPSSLDARLRMAAAYSWATTSQKWRFRHYRSHRPVSAAREAIGWARRLARRERTEREAQDAAATLDQRRYFIFPLQLDSDFQVRLHSPFTGMAEAIGTVVASFAKAAPDDHLLAIKEHPLDNGLIDWRAVIAKEGEAHGVLNRIVFLQGGDIARLVAHARGVVTVNSTTGTLALAASVPTIVLGRAVYDVPRITHQTSLDGFWRQPVPPDPQVWEAFCRVLRDRVLIHGGLLSEEGIAMLVAGAVERLTRVRVPATALTLPVAHGHEVPTP